MEIRLSAGEGSVGIQRLSVINGVIQQRFNPGLSKIAVFDCVHIIFCVILFIINQKEHNIFKCDNHCCDLPFSSSL